MKTLFIFILSCSLVCCGSQELPVIPANENEEEVQLGTSPYYMNLPQTFRLEEARGKEGQLGYNIIPLDTTSSMHGFIEIEAGRPHGGLFMGDHPKDYVRSTLLDETVTWKMEQSEDSGSFNAYAKKNGIKVTAGSKDKAEVDSMIAIITSIRKDKTD